MVEVASCKRWWNRWCTKERWPNDMMPAPLCCWNQSCCPVWAERNWLNECIPAPFFLSFSLSTSLAQSSLSTLHQYQLHSDKVLIVLASVLSGCVLISVCPPTPRPHLGGGGGGCANSKFQTNKKALCSSSPSFLSSCLPCYTHQTQWTCSFANSGNTQIRSPSPSLSSFAHSRHQPEHKTGGGLECM